MCQDISKQRLAKLREQPLHRHCRELLDRAGRSPNTESLGAPELMLWGLEQPDIQAELGETTQLWGVVEMLLGKPSLADRVVSEAISGQEEAALTEEEPVQLARLLLRAFRQHMGGVTGGSQE